MSLEVLATTLLPRLTARLPGAGGVARIETIRLNKDGKAMHNLLPRLTARLPGAGGVVRIAAIRLIKDAEAMHNLLFDQLTDQPMSI